MKTALVLDIDGTLTAARQPITGDVVRALDGLKVPFFLDAGTHFELLQVQFFDEMYNYGFRSKFEAYLSNGAMQYYCDYTISKYIKLKSQFILKDYLGEFEYAYLIDALQEILDNDNFRLPDNVTLFDDRLVDRVSMINLCPIGRDGKGAASLDNRFKFKQFDKNTNFRYNVIQYLNSKLYNIIRDKNLYITYGGETSFDIGIIGQDKTKVIRRLVDEGYDEIIFIGDALYDHGNDAIVREYVENWPHDFRCPVRTIQVKSYHDTLDILRMYM